MSFAEGLLTIAFIQLLAAMLPGPDFVVVTKETLQGGKRAGNMAALGITLGLFVHVCYSIFGFATILAHSPSVLYWIKLLGGVYLIFLGISTLLAKKEKNSSQQKIKIQKHTDLHIIKRGFMCNLLNPKAPPYFVALFTIVISPNTPFYQLAIYGLLMMAVQFLWFVLLAFIFSTQKVQNIFSKVEHYVSYMLGLLMIGFGIKILFL